MVDLNAIMNEVEIKIYVLYLGMKHWIMSQGNNWGVIKQKIGWGEWMDPKFWK